MCIRDSVPPEHALDFRQIRFVQVGAIARRLQVDPADLNIQSVFLRGNDEIGAIPPQLAVDLVADVGGDGNHRRSYPDAQGNGNAC